MKRFATVALLAVGTVIACAKPQGEQPRPARTDSVATPIPDIPVLPPVTGARGAYYRRAFSRAAQFLPRPIPSEMIRSADQGNDVYIEARDDAGKTIGYLRDFSGPVSIDGGLETKPLDITLAFDTGYQLTTVISADPIYKKGGAEMTGLDIDRLVAIGRAPSELLQRARSVEEVVDATTGATKPEYRGSVVDAAGLTTARIVHLLRDTTRILQAAPRVWDRRRLQAVLNDFGDQPDGRARALAALVPVLDTPAAAVEAYRGMVRAYIDAQKAGGEPDTTVERRLISPGIDPVTDAGESLDACYSLVNAGVRFEVADRCGRTVAKSDAASSGPRVDPANLARLNGTLSYLAGETREAVAPLRTAAGKFELSTDPLLHYRLADSLAREMQLTEACTVAKAIFLEHPLLPGAKKLLQSCRPDDHDIVPVMQDLYRDLQDRLLQSRIDGKPPVPILPVEDDSFTGTDIELYEPGKVTVAVFFSTWCPHCRTELPHIVAFTRMAERDPRLAGNVRVLAVRTAVEQETEPYEAFKARLDPNFTIWTDPVMALAFSKFAKSQGIPPALPTLAVIDERGFVRYFLPPGDYRDTVRELYWAVEDLVANPDKPEPIVPGPDAGETPAAAGTTAPVVAPPSTLAPAPLRSIREQKKPGGAPAER